MQRIYSRVREGVYRNVLLLNNRQVVCGISSERMKKKICNTNTIKRYIDVVFVVIRSGSVWRFGPLFLQHDVSYRLAHSTTAGDTHAIDFCSVVEFFFFFYAPDQRKWSQSNVPLMCGNTLLQYRIPTYNKRIDALTVYAVYTQILYVVTYLYIYK